MDVFPERVVPYDTIFVFRERGSSAIFLPFLLLVQSDFTSGHFSGLACRPADLSIALFRCFVFCRGIPILAGGIGVARVWVLVFSGVFSVWLRAITVSVTLHFTRLGLMPHSAWSKKKSSAIFC